MVEIFIEVFMKYIRARRFLRSQVGTTMVEGSELMRGYEMSDMAVDAVRKSSPRSLIDLRKIKNVPAGSSLGKYVSLNFTEDQYKVFSEALQRGEINESNFPDVNFDVLNSGHIIEVSTTEIINRVSAGVSDVLDFHYNVIREIAKTIVHEATHGEQEKRREQDRQKHQEGQAWISEQNGEAEAEASEAVVESYFKTNQKIIYQEILDRLVTKGQIDQDQISRYQEIINQMG